MKIFLAGHKGLVGSAILRKLIKKKYKNIILADKRKLNLLDQAKVLNFLKKKKPDLVIIAAAKVGGIYHNDNYSADFIYENLQIQNNLIHGSFKNNIKNLIFLAQVAYTQNSLSSRLKRTIFYLANLRKQIHPMQLQKLLA